MQENKKISETVFEFKEKKKLFLNGKVKVTEFENLAENLQKKISTFKQKGS